MRKLLLLTGLSFVLSACGGGGGGGSSSGSSSGSGGGTNPPIPTNCYEGTYIRLDKANIVVQDANGNILPRNAKGEWVANDDRVKIVIPYSTDARCVGSGINFSEGNTKLGRGCVLFFTYDMVLFWRLQMRKIILSYSYNTNIPHG